MSQAPQRPNAGAARPPRGRFRLRLTIAAVVLVLAPAIAIGAFGLSRYRQALEAQARDNTFNALSDLSGVAEQELRDVEEQLDVLVSLLARPELPAAQRLKDAGNMLALSLQVGVVAIYDGEGRHIGALRKPGDKTEVPPTLPHELVPPRPQEGEPPRSVVGPAVFSEGSPRLPVARKLVLPNEEWTLLAPLFLQRLGQRLAVLAESRFTNDLDSLLVVDSELVIVASSSSDETAQKIGEKLPRPSWLTAEDLRAIRANSVFRGERVVDERGARLVTIRRVPGSPLLFIAQIDEAAMLEPFHRQRLIVIAVSVTAAALAVLLGIWWSRRAAAPIASLASFADDLAARRFDKRVQITSGDELETVGDAVNDAAAALAAGETELAKAAAIRADLSRFLPAQLVERVVERKHTLELGGQRRPITVLFADVAGFTSLVERHSPEAVTPILHELFTLLTELIFRHRGTVDKFIGDCVMALWNAPDAEPEHAELAVRCAQDMLRWVELANTVWEKKSGVAIHLAIGIHTGEATVGNFGSKVRMEYTAMGDTVNVASRLEHLARPQQILVGGATRRAAPAAGTYVALGSTRLAGRQEPVEIFEVIAD